MEDLVKGLLKKMGENPLRPELEKTPKRVAETLKFLTGGSDTVLAEILDGAVFDHKGDGPVLVRDIPFYSLCEHHMLPFFGSGTIAYVPNGRLIGLSKLPRVLDTLSRRLQVQERLTCQVADALFETLKPSGLGVSLDARHLCMEMRGVMKPGNVITTYELRGEFKDNPDSFYSML